MPYITGTLQPAQVALLRCPRCWFTGPFVPDFSLQLRCTRCEWLFTLAAPSLSAAPAFPATTVVITSPYPTPVTAVVAANGATITNVSLNGTTAGAAAGTYIIPAAGTFSCTYTVATPTWTWALPQTSALVAAGATSLPFTHFGTSFAVGQVLIVDPAGTADVVTVTGVADTAVTVTALAFAHATTKNVTVAQLTPSYSSTGEQAVPQNTY